MPWSLRGGCQLSEPDLPWGHVLKRLVTPALIVEAKPVPNSLLQVIEVSVLAEVDVAAR